MENKEMIVDGVDVSRCCHQGKDNTCTCPHYKKECGRNPNCHYKIMQRQIKKLDKFYKSELELKQKLFRKEQECEELKKKKEENTTFYLKKYANKDNECSELQHKVNIFKATLIKIKEVCKNNDELQGDFNVVDCDKYRLGKHNLAKKITQKISECGVIND